jgi:hypothetical protein
MQILYHNVQLSATIQKHILPVNHKVGRRHGWRVHRVDATLSSRLLSLPRL